MNYSEFNLILPEDSVIRKMDFIRCLENTRKNLLKFKEEQIRLCIKNIDLDFQDRLDHLEENISRSYKELDKEITQQTLEASQASSSKQE